MADEPRGREDGRIHLAFDRDFLTIPVAAIVPLACEKSVVRLIYFNRKPYE